MSTADDPSECVNLREDYFECLHHRKEIRRDNKVKEQQAKTFNAMKDEMKVGLYTLTSFRGFFTLTRACVRSFLDFPPLTRVTPW
jgi:predicted phage-related endonuclease